jgi:hypothetical protein
MDLFTAPSVPRNKPPTWRPASACSTARNWPSGPVHFDASGQTERGFVLHEDQCGDGGAYSSTLSVPGGLAKTTSKD